MYWRCGVSRSLLDDYLENARQPSIAQVDRLASAAGLRADVVWHHTQVPVSAEFVIVMERAEALPHENFAPMRFPSMLGASM